MLAYCTSPLEQLVETLGPMGVGNADSRQIDEEPHLGVSVRGLLQELHQLRRHPEIDFLDHAERFGSLDELPRRDDAAIVTLDADQHLMVHHRVVGQPYHRLGIKQQPVFVEYLAQLLRPENPLMRPLHGFAAILAVGHDPVTAGILGLVERDVGRGQ